MTEKIDWKQELLDSEKFNKKQENLLKNGAKSLTVSWLLGALYIRWKKLKSFREQPSPDFSSSFQGGIKKLKMQTYASLDNWVTYLRQTPRGRAKRVCVSRAISN